MNATELRIADFTYDLPTEKIALHPLEQRDHSKLLIYKDRVISEDVFYQLTEHIPEGSMMVFNSSKVINARLQFRKESGGIIEIFLLEPLTVQDDYASSLNAKKPVRWKCFIGGASKWKERLLQMNVVIEGNKVALFVEKIAAEGEAYIVEFSWEPTEYSFAEVIEKAGAVPLPPYIKRKAENADSSRYQTIYAKTQGSVAAPTAGLHITEAVMQQARKKNIDACYTTLHVGAGTFKPVKAAQMSDHTMHAEWMEVSADEIKQLVSAKKIIAVGTTSLRTLESLYWMGLKIKNGETEIGIKQWEVYELEKVAANTSRKEALEFLKKFVETQPSKKLFIQTQILISPGYTFKMVDYMVTNFHQPQSTLLLLVAAAIGEDWRKVYDYALQKDFRFLSYGDASLLKIGID